MLVNLNSICATPILSGAINGLAAAAEIAKRLPVETGIDFLILDFKDVDIATGSFLRSLLASLREHCARDHPGTCVVVANASDAVREELVDRLQANRDAVVICTLSPKGVPISPRVIGILEDKLAETLLAVLDAGESDAPTLAKLDDEGDGSPNKWNNRLAALAAKGILKERRDGRVKKYRAVFEGLRYGS